MKLPLVVVACLASSVLSCFALYLAWPEAMRPLPIATAANESAALADLRAQVASLTRRLESMPIAAPAPVARQDAAALPADAAPAAPGATADAHWYLAQYVRSFAIAAQGSEYYRLAVDAHADELAEAIAALVRDPARPTPLRIALAVMLGRPAFATTDFVIDALLAAAAPPQPLELARTTLTALARIGSAAAVPGLEQLVLQRTDAAREQALVLLAELAGDDRNAILLRLWHATGDEMLRQALIRALDSSDAIAALDLLSRASAEAQPLRLAAAHEIGEHDDPGIDALVERWRAVEADAAVLAALGASAAAAGWGPPQATGAPDADASRDDPKAWAPREPEMGRQWLQLSFPQAVTAHGVRVFEVNAPGALVEVLGKAPDGSWLPLWRGTTEPSGGSPRVLTWSAPSVPIRTVRLVLDTDRTPGWNEIDAVELLGPAGGQWAVRATASSTFATGQRGDRDRGELLLQTRR